MLAPTHWTKFVWATKSLRSARSSRYGPRGVRGRRPPPGSTRPAGGEGGRGRPTSRRSRSGKAGVPGGVHRRRILAPVPRSAAGCASGRAVSAELEPPDRARSGGRRPPDAGPRTSRSRRSPPWSPARSRSASGRGGASAGRVVGVGGRERPEVGRRGVAIVIETKRPDGAARSDERGDSGGGVAASSRARLRGAGNPTGTRSWTSSPRAAAARPVGARRPRREEQHSGGRPCRRAGGTERRLGHRRGVRVDADDERGRLAPGARQRRLDRRRCRGRRRPGRRAAIRVGELADVHLVDSPADDAAHGRESTLPRCQRRRRPTPIGPYERRRPRVRPWDPRALDVAARVIAIVRPARPDLHDRAHREHGGPGPAGQGDHRPRDRGRSGRDPGDHRGDARARVRAAAGPGPVAADPADARRLGRRTTASSTGSTSTSTRAAIGDLAKDLRFRDALRADPALRRRATPDQGRRSSDRAGGPVDGGQLPGREGRLDPRRVRPARDRSGRPTSGRPDRRGRACPSDPHRQEERHDRCDHDPNERRVGIVVGSRSDIAAAERAMAVLDELEVDSEIRVISAHRAPDLLARFIAGAEARGIRRLHRDRRARRASAGRRRVADDAARDRRPDGRRRVGRARRTARDRPDAEGRAGRDGRRRQRRERGAARRGDPGGRRPGAARASRGAARRPRPPRSPPTRRTRGSERSPGAAVVACAPP